MKAGCVVLTAGGRDAELVRAVASVAAQRDAELDLLVVANGVDVVADARILRLAANGGPAAGRNASIAEVDGEILFFLDDDTWYGDPTLVARALDRFAADPALGILSFRIDSPDGGAPQRRHVPRLRAGDPHRSSAVTTFLEGACAIRRVVFDRVGGYPEEFFFGHEGTDLAWRALDAGFAVRYAGDLAVNHPAEPPTRHATHHRMTMRNRVFLARRRLPAVLAPVYVGVWLALSLARSRSLAAAVDTLRGAWAGLREPCGPRRPISWRTVWRMTLAGRPPVV